nr:hypothetical protein [Bacteroidales bacterium]
MKGFLMALKVLGFVFLELIVIAMSLMLATMSAPMSVSVLVGVLVAGILSFVVALFSHNTLIKSAKLDKSVSEEALLRRTILEKDFEIKKLKEDNFQNETILKNLEQTKHFFAQNSVNPRLELFQIESSGYIVKQDNVETVLYNSELADVYPKNNLFQDIHQGFKEWLGNERKQQIIYVKKNDYRAAYGIELNSCYYAEHNNEIYVSGLEIMPLHSYSIGSDSSSDVEYCWLMDSKSSGMDKKFIEDKKYQNFIKKYESVQMDMYDKTMKKQADIASKQYTMGLQETLLKKYPQLRFVDKDDYNKFEWKSMASLDAQSATMIMVASDIVMGLNMLSSGYSDKSKISLC